MYKIKMTNKTTGAQKTITTDRAPFDFCFLFCCTLWHGRRVSDFYTSFIKVNEYLFKYKTRSHDLIFEVIS